MNETFRRATFNISEVLVSLTFGKGGNYSKRRELAIGFERTFDNSLGVLEIYSEQGRCYSLHAKTVIDPDTIIIMVLNIQR